MAGRILFPIQDEAGVLVGYAGRGTNPRYLNTPGLPRSRVLYGLPAAKPELHRSGTLYLVEGFKDTLAMHAAGFTGTVALMGTQMAEEQQALITRYARTVVLVMDGDPAGREAAGKIAARLEQAGLETVTVQLPEGTDPDSVFTAQGREALIACIKQYTEAPAPEEERLLLALHHWPEQMTEYRGVSMPFLRMADQLLEQEGIPFCRDIPPGQLALLQQRYNILFAYVPEEAVHGFLYDLLLHYLETTLIRR